ncbi:MAG: hypothetical protein KDC26_10615 [Armatimonadetes bacterium]|nr:hypothetical protein [Armatimonadota bacterium]
MGGKHFRWKSVFLLSTLLLAFVALASAFSSDIRHVPTAVRRVFNPGLPINTEVTDPLLLTKLPTGSANAILVYVGECSSCSMKSILSWELIPKEDLNWVLIFSSKSDENLEAVALFETKGVDADYIIDSNSQIQKYLGVTFVNQTFYFEGNKLIGKQASSLDAPEFLTEVVR